MKRLIACAHTLDDPASRFRIRQYIPYLERAGWTLSLRTNHPPRPWMSFRCTERVTVLPAVVDTDAYEVRAADDQARAAGVSSSGAPSRRRESRGYSISESCRRCGPGFPHS